jgi:hypothetical protein
VLNEYCGSDYGGYAIVVIAVLAIALVADALAVGSVLA